MKWFRTTGDISQALKEHGKTIQLLDFGYNYITLMWDYDKDDVDEYLVRTYYYDIHTKEIYKTVTGAIKNSKKKG